MEDTAVMEDLLLSAAVDVRKVPTVSIIAYNGNLMTVPVWGPVALDLAGLDLAGSVAILSDHDSTRRGIVGHGRAQVMDGRLVVTGSISVTGAAAREIVDASKNGFPWQASVGVEVLERRRVAAGETVTVNGKSIEADGNGFTLVSKGRLREVSIVGIGCDGNTAVAIAASKVKEKSMEAQVQEVEVQEKDGLDAQADEAKRVANVAVICEKHPEIKTKAISEGWDETKAELEVLRASRPKVPSAHLSERPSGVVTLEAAVLGHMGMLSLGEKALGAAAMEQAALLGATSMLDLCRAALVADGVEVPRSRPEMVKAALSTYSLPVALSNVANKLLLDAYNEVPASWRAFCAIRSTADFKPNTGVRPSFSTPLEQLAPGGEFKHGTVGEWSMQYRVDTFGRMLEIDRRDLINDDLSVFADTAQALGRAAMRRLSDLVFETLLANAGGFFSAGNGNYFDGADSALSFDGLAKAIMLMRTQRDDEDNDLDLKPATLLVTPELETTARALLNSEYIQRAENIPTGNSLRQAVNLEVEPRLANTAKFGSAASTKHWYLFAARGATEERVRSRFGRQNAPGRAVRCPDLRHPAPQVRVGAWHGYRQDARQERRSVSCGPAISMMEAAQERLCHDTARSRRLDLPRDGRVPIQQQVRAGFLVVRDILGQNGPEVPLVEHDQMVQTLPSDRADQPLGVWILPRRPRADDDFLDAHRLDLLPEVASVDAVAVSQHEPRRCVEGERLDDLSGRPPRRGAGRDTEVHDSTAVMAKHQEAEEDAERDRWNREEADGRDLAGVVVQESTPSL